MKINTKKAHIILIILGSIFVSLSIFHTNMWFDEAYSVALAKHSFSEIWTIGGNDVHPILYYWMLHMVQILTNGSIIAYRIFSAIPIIILGILGFTHIKKDFGEKTGFIFSLLVYFMPATAVYTNQIRMYSWAILSVTILCIYAYRIYKGEDTTKNLIIFGLASWFSIYTHYYGLMTAGIVNVILLIYLIIKKRKKSAIIIILFGIIQLVSYIPWLINFIKQLNHVSSGFWIGFEFPKTFIELLGFELLGDYITEKIGIYHYIIFAISIALYIYLAIKIIKLKKENIYIKNIILAIIIYFTVIFAALIVTIILKTSILYYRYLFVITGLYIFLFSYIIANEKNKYIKISICLIFIILGTINNIKMINTNYNKVNYEPIEFIKENILEDDVIVSSDAEICSIVANVINNKQYFYNNKHWHVEEAYKAFLPQMHVYEDESFLKECNNRVWFVGFTDSINKEIIEKNNYKIIENKYYETKYQNYTYSVILAEKQ